MTLRPATRPPDRRLALIGSAVVASIAASIAALLLIADRPPTVPPVTKVIVMPAVPVAVPVPVASTPPSPQPPVVLDPPPIRATSPHVHAECVLQSEHTPCTWDRGFPAISADGKTIVREHHENDGARRNPNLSIQFIDVATSRTKELLILSSDEADLAEDTLRPKITARVAKATKLLAAGAYRTLVPLSDAYAPSGTRLRVETSGSIVRILDSEDRTELVRADYTIPHGSPTECIANTTIEDAKAWWDPETRTVLATLYYSYGGCVWGGETRAYVEHIR